VHILSENNVNTLACLGSSFYRYKTAFLSGRERKTNKIASTGQNNFNTFMSKEVLGIAFDLKLASIQVINIMHVIV